ncbi:DUF4132 domain-containing protein [uncultured Parabacteroides sp.]|jgi:hypothetical protein|uniref:DUF4132 domain-containing protein n=1 Tax=uncultured Parabacteroides sp. TaxID=512312 RepID=UPI0025CC76EF|nr:DUF4132 domain-containing protein [uncultured Parabacteroides sp.]
MTKEQMLEQWSRSYEQAYYKCDFTPKVYEYLEGKIDQVPEMIMSRPKIDTSYDGWLLYELNGENAELARRMLVIISKIRRDGPIHKWGLKNELEICLRIGYGHDFKNLIQESVSRHKAQGPELYEIAETLLKYCPAESEAFADQLLSNKLKELEEQRNSNHELYLALYLMILFLEQDAGKYARYLPVLTALTSKYSGPNFTYILYFSYKFSPELKVRLLHSLKDKISARALFYHLTPYKMPAFLQSIEAPLDIYYYLVLTEDNDIDKPSLFHTLYKENKELFMNVYRMLAETTSIQQAANSLYLLAILLENGEGTEELAASKELQARCMLNLQENPSGNVDKLISAAMNESTPQATWEKFLKDCEDFVWAYRRNKLVLLIGALALLYERSELSKRFIDILLIQIRTGYTINNPRYVTYFFLKTRKEWLGCSPKESIRLLLDTSSQFTYEKAFRAYVYNPDRMQDTLDKEDIIANQSVALDLLNNGGLSTEETQNWINMLYGTCKISDVSPLLGILSNKSKILRKTAEELIGLNEETIRPLLEAERPKMKGDALATAKRIIKRWDNERKFGADFTFTKESVVEYCNDNFDKDNVKFITWIPEDMFTDVRFADMAEKAPAIVTRYILSEYLSLEEAYKVKACDKVVEQLHAPDFQQMMENIYQFWKENGAEAKKKMIMVPYCIYGSDTQILRLKTQLKDWAEASRGAIAAFVVNAIAMNGGSVALVMIDGISVKFPNNQVKNAAKAAFTFAAKALEIPEDELSDKIVPTLGFNKEGEKILDYGPRNFTVTLMPDFSLSIFDNEKQKTIKSMPAPGTNDDTVKATAAKKEFSELKKQIKATVQSQTNRLEKVLMNGRRWTVDSWNTLFVENPIMHRFATGLIWGVYDGEKLTGTFRYMEDGTFNTVDEEEYTLPEKAAITLVHPIELEEDVLAGWKEQLDDYEIVQPVTQLTAPIIVLGEKETNGNKITRYNGLIVKSGKISGIARKHNMVRGEVWDGGSYTCYHLVDKFLNIAALLNFEYMYMGQEYDDDVTLGDIVLYRMGEDQTTDDEPKNEIILSPESVPTRFLCSVLGIFDVLKEE